MDKPAPAPTRPPVTPALIAPLVTAIAVAGLLGVARIYDSLPFQPPPCGLRTLTGIPCLGCGGTRCVKALARGDIATAFFFNPLVALAVLGVFVWLVAALIRSRLPASHRSLERKPIPMPWIIAGVVLLVAANWTYLILFLPW
jgi:hypothetical protein